MRSRPIKMEDGRYLIFYTFDEEAAHVETRAAAAVSDAPHREEEDAADAVPEAEEEQRV